MPMVAREGFPILSQSQFPNQRARFLMPRAGPERQGRARIWEPAEKHHSPLSHMNRPSDCSMNAPLIRHSPREDPACKGSVISPRIGGRQKRFTTGKARRMRKMSEVQRRCAH
eukprot:2818783-Pyramimonas_sp.AAC.1